MATAAPLRESTSVPRERRDLFPGRSRVTLGLGVAAYALALVQRPGMSTSDTKINLHVDPVAFLGQVASVWSPTDGLGHVQGGQYSGYLWPMGPFFAVGHLIGLSAWLTERLWFGTLLALSAWGAVRLVDALFSRERGVAHIVAGAIYMVNPYVVVIASRTTEFLLAYAALPWLLLVVHRGLRDPRRWFCPAAFALIVASTGGGVNATVTAYVLLGPVLLGIYEATVGGAGLRAALAFGWRAMLAVVLASLWWMIPLLVQSRYGLNFLLYTEHVGAIWGPTSLSESLRLMGYWPTYLGVGFADHLIPYFGGAGTLLFNPFVVVASLLVPGLAFAGYLWTRRWRFAPFFLASAVIALAVMSVGYPDGTLARRGFTFLYNHLSSFQFLRTTYKAGPVLAIAVAMLGGAAASTLWQRSRASVRAAAAAAGAGLLVAAALPLFQGRAIELTWNSVPSAWLRAAADLNRLPANSRAIVLPGQAFAFYRWGGTVDPILPALTRLPVAIRNTPPFDDTHAIDFLWTVDDLVQQQRLLPGELKPLLGLMGVSAVVVATDDDDALTGALAPAPAARELAAQGLGRPSRSYGPERPFAAADGTAASDLRLPEVRAYDIRSPGLLRIEPAAQPTIVDGSAEGVADIAALGSLPSSRALMYAGDMSAPAIRRAAAAGADVFITDSNRRRVFVASRVRDDTGATVAADEPFPADAALLDPFSRAGSPGQTVATLRGARYIRAPYNPELAQFPEHRPYAAFDADPHTSWRADTSLDRSRQWVEIGLNRPRSVPYVDLLPDQSDPAVALTAIEINGRRFALHPGWNRLPVDLRHVTAVRAQIAGTRTQGADTSTIVGIAELRIPGVHVREYLRPPVLAERALRGDDLRRSAISYVFQRTTAADPLRRGPAPAHVAPQGDVLQREAALIAGAQDAETGITRVIDPPVARSWGVSGLASVSPSAADPALDRIAGTDIGGARFSSSARLQGIAGYRASAAFDDKPSTAWLTPFNASQPAWIAWTTRAPRTLTHLVLQRSSLPASFPTRVSVSAAGRTTAAIAVSRSGSVAFPQPIRADRFRLNILGAAGPNRDAVAIAGITGSGAPVVSRAVGNEIRGRCGDLVATIGGRSIALRLQGTVSSFDRGDALRLNSCGPLVPLPQAPMAVSVRPSVTRPLLIELHSPAPTPVAPAGPGGGQVIDSGHEASGAFTNVRVHVGGPSWLVLAESYSRGWRATCNGHSLGPPQALDGFANGWRVAAACRTVSVTFGPQRGVELGYLAGGVSCVLLAVILILELRRRRRTTAASAPPESSPLLVPAAPPAWRPAPKVAMTVGVVAAGAFGIMFGLRASAVVGPTFALILWRGIPTRLVLLIVGALLVIVVPVLYLAFPGTNQGGYDTGYAAEHMGAHWVTVAAFALLVFALAGDLLAALRPVWRARGQ